MRAPVLGFLLAAVPTVLSAQAASTPATAAPAPAKTATTPATPAPSGAPAPAGSEGAVESAAAALVVPGFSYNPEGRRDPFVSLLRRGSGVSTTVAGARPAGLAGLAVGETTLKGILASEGGFVAMLQGSDEKTYIVRPNDTLMDGSIRTITKDTVVFVQQVDDPLSREKQHEVRKVLRQTEEAK